jgi:hypothetical protein
VALAAFAASGISGGDPFKTGVQGFIYELRTAVLPFVFLYNQEILLIGLQGVWHFLWVLLTAGLACMAFASATQRFMFIRNRRHETLLLLAAMIFLFRPDIPHDLLFHPYQEQPPARTEAAVAALEPGQAMRLHLLTTFGDGRVKDQVVVLPWTGQSAEERLASAGVRLAWEGRAGGSGPRLMIDDVAVNSRLEKLGVNMDDPTEVLGLETPAPRPAKWMFSSPGLLLLALVAYAQRRRLGRAAVGCSAS